ncbi:MAG: AsmA-like C-terminal region-containing protein, partial [Pseudomonadota bacterium]
MAGIIGGSFDAGSRLKNVKLEGESLWKRGRLVFETAQLAIGSHVATGSLAIAHKGDEPNISGTLDFKTFDLAHLLATGPSADDTGPTLEQWWSVIWDKLRNPMRAPLGVDLRLSAEQLKFGLADLGRSAMTLSLHKGTFRAQFAEVAFAGGEGSGELGINFNRARSNITIGGAVNNADITTINALLPKALAMPLDGPARIELDLTTEGSNTREAIGRLAGTLRVLLPEGGALKLDARKLSEISGVASYEKLAGETAIEKFSAELAFFNGQAFCRHLKALTATHIIEGAGSLDLDSLDVAFLGGVREKPAKTAPETPPNAAYGSAATAAPSATPDPANRRRPTFRLKGNVSALEVAPYQEARDKDLLSITPLFD